MSFPTEVHPAEGYSGFIGWVLSLMESIGEFGVGAAVFIETFVPPIPSEAVLPVAGYLAYEGRMSFWFAWLAATLGSLAGALVWYAIGAALGRNRTRALVGRIPLMEHDDFDKAEAFFLKWGKAAVLFGRCVPLVRSFISIPAGIARMHLLSFTVYTAIGSAVWNGVWIGLGFAFGPALQPVLSEWSGVLSDIAVIVIAGLCLWFVAARLLRRWRGSRADA